MTIEQLELIEKALKFRRLDVETSDYYQALEYIGKEINMLGVRETSVSPNKPQNLKCPDCDGEMVPRSGRYGKFWGCKKFPNCRGTRDDMGRSKAEREAEKSQQVKNDHEDVGPDNNYRWIR